MNSQREHEHPIVESPLTTRFFTVPQGVRLVEPADGSPGVTFPRGFVASGISVGLKQSGRPDMGVLAVADEWWGEAVSGTVATTNAFAAAPVVVTRNETEPGRLVAVAINSGNANACTGDKGLQVARAMQRSCANVLGASVERTAVGSTGIIGVQLDADFMTAATARASEEVVIDGGKSFARAIMTTDRFVKECAIEVDLPAGTVRLAACGKGAGMIAPAMATMLCVVTTDAQLEAGDAQALLEAAVADSFNMVTVDGEMSTNDSVYFLASGASKVSVGEAGRQAFLGALRTLLLRIALMMVADGEGATKIMRVRISGADDDTCAAHVCRAVADSPLVKTAMHGGDPNWGRIISSVGAALPGRSLPDVALYMCGVQVVENGTARAVPAAEWAQLKAGMQAPEVEIDLDLGVGTGAAELYFADMGHEYITINAEYHS